MAERPKTRDLRWAATVGELCGRAGGGLAPERAFLDVWLELTGAERGALITVQADGSTRAAVRGLDPEPGPPSVDSLELSLEAGRLAICATELNGRGARLVAEPADAALHDDVLAVLPLVQTALLRLARGPENPAEAAALKAWSSAPTPMILLDNQLAVVATNPAAQRRLKLRPSGGLPGWLDSWLDRELRDGARGHDGSWTARADGLEYHLSVATVDLGEGIPGRWLVSIERGGPTLTGRLQLAKARYGLTPREIQSLELVAEGLSNQEVAAALDIAEATVKFHLFGVMRKTGVTSRTELLARLHAVHVVDGQVDIPPGAHRLGQAYVFEDEGGIIHWIQDQGARMDGPDVEEFIALLGREFGDRPRLVYSDATGVRSASRSAHRAAEGPFPEMTAAAMRGGSGVARAIVNLWLSVSTQNYPVKMFRDREPALEWLRSLPLDD